MNTHEDNNFHHENPSLDLAKHEKVADNATRFFDALKNLGVEGVSEEQRISYIEHAATSDFIAATQTLHDLVAGPDVSREPTSSAMGLVDSQTGEVRSVTATPDTRQAIMEHGLIYAQKLIADYRINGGDSNDILNRCANLAAFSIVLAHSYEDANGRTARALGELIRNGYDGVGSESHDDLTILIQNRPEEGFKIQTYIPFGEWGDGRANNDPFGFLERIAAAELPFDGVQYTDRVSAIAKTP